MPTLPLFTPNDQPDASHRVVAPGGYESWHFDAESAAGDVRIVATLGEGCISDADYWRRYLRYRRRPTRRPPPLPADYPWADVAVYEREKVVGRFTTLFPPTQFAASTERPEVTAGSNGFVRETDGTFSLRLRGLPPGHTTRASDANGNANFAAQLAFRPLRAHAPRERLLRRAPANTDAHSWVIAQPLCDVSGVISLATGSDTRASRGPREIDFRGRGYHDHRYGTGPLGVAFKRTFTGRAIFADVVYAFYAAQPVAGTDPDAVHLLRFDTDGATEMTPDSIALDWAGNARAPWTYPSRLACGTHLRLTNPRMIDRSASTIRLVYQAATDSATGVGIALCEVFTPPKTGWGRSGSWLGSWKRREGTQVRVDI